MGVAAAMAALSKRRSVGAAASLAATVLARPAFVTICIIVKQCVILMPEQYSSQDTICSFTFLK